MLEKVSAALNTTPTTIPQTPHIFKNPPKKKLGNNFVREARNRMSSSVHSLRDSKLNSEMKRPVQQRLDVGNRAGAADTAF